MLLRLYPDSRARLLEAKAHLEQAIRLQPQFFDARKLLAQVNEALD